MTRQPRAFLGLDAARWLARGRLTPEDEAEIQRLREIQKEAERAKFLVVLRATTRTTKSGAN